MAPVPWPPLLLPVPTAQTATASATSASAHCPDCHGLCYFCQCPLPRLPRPPLLLPVPTAQTATASATSASAHCPAWNGLQMARDMASGNSHRLWCKARYSKALVYSLRKQTYSPTFSVDHLQGYLCLQSPYIVNTLRYLLTVTEIKLSV